MPPVAVLNEGEIKSLIKKICGVTLGLTWNSTVILEYAKIGVARVDATLKDFLSYDTAVRMSGGV